MRDFLHGGLSGEARFYGQLRGACVRGRPVIARYLSGEQEDVVFFSSNFVIARI